MRDGGWWTILEKCVRWPTHPLSVIFDRAVGDTATGILLDLIDVDDDDGHDDDDDDDDDDLEGEQEGRWTVIDGNWSSKIGWSSLKHINEAGSQLVIIGRK